MRMRTTGCLMISCKNPIANKWLVTSFGVKLFLFPFHYTFDVRPPYLLARRCCLEATSEHMHAIFDLAIDSSQDDIVFY